jgi:hypothetical protein
VSERRLLLDRPEACNHTTGHPRQRQERLGQGLGHERLGQGLGHERLGQGLGHERLGQRLGHERLGQGLGQERLGQGMGHERLGQGMGHERLGQGLNHERLGQGLNHERLGQGLGHERLGLCWWAGCARCVCGRKIEGEDDTPFPPTPTLPPPLRDKLRARLISPPPQLAPHASGQAIAGS